MQKFIHNSAQLHLVLSLNNHSSRTSDSVNNINKSIKLLVFYNFLNKSLKNALDQIYQRKYAYKCFVFNSIGKKMSGIFKNN